MGMGMGMGMVDQSGMTAMGGAPGGRRPGGAPVEGMDGNWKCPQCSNINFGQRDSCNRCQAPKPPPEYIAQREAIVQATAPGSGGGSAGGRGAPHAGVDGNWKCSGCGNVNFKWRESCNRCGTAKEIGNPSLMAGVQQFADANGQVYSMDASGQLTLNHSSGFGASMGGGDLAFGATIGQPGPQADLLPMVQQMQQQMMTMQSSITTLHGHVQQLQQNLTLISQQSQLAAMSGSSGPGLLASGLPGGLDLGTSLTGSKRKADEQLNVGGQ